MPTEQELRDRQRDQFLQRLPGEVEIVEWPLERVCERRDRFLRDLVRHAIEHSAWHRERLADVDVDALSGEDMSALPTMTKSDLMDNWDAICCDPELTLERAVAHLEDVAKHGPSYLLDKYMVVTTGGSSGHRAVVAWDWDGLLESALGRYRHLAWILQKSPPTRPLSQARLMPQGTMHISAVLDHVFALPGVDVRTYPPAMAPSEVAAGMQDMQPLVITGYPSLVRRMAREQMAGRLSISPEYVALSGEPLPDEVRDDVMTAWGARSSDIWGATESGEIAISNPVADDPAGAMHRLEDANVIEPVDDQGRPVPPGVAASGLYVTNVLNKVLPIIRYEIDDKPTFMAEPNPGPWTGRRIKPISGRAYASLTYPGGTDVDVHAIGLIMREMPDMLEYQYRQTETGADIDVALDRPIDLEPARARIAELLRGNGVDDPQVVMHVVDQAPRNPRTGKITQYVALGVKLH